MPAPDRAAEVVGQIGPDDGPLRPVLAAELSRLAGTPVDPSMWDDLVLPEHLRPYFRIVGGGEVLAEGGDLAELERRPPGPRPVDRGLPGTRSSNATVSPAGRSARFHRWWRHRSTASPSVGYPALIDTTDSVGVRVLAAATDQQQALHWNGTRRLLALQLPRPARALQRAVDARVLLGLTTAPHGSVSAAVDDALHAVLDAILLAEGGPVWDEAAFDRLLGAVRARYLDDLVALVSVMSEAVQRFDRLRERISAPAPVEWSPALDDVAGQLGRLVFAGMAVGIGADRVAHVPRYLDAIDVRLDRLREGVRADTDRMATIRRLETEHAGLVAAARSHRRAR